MSPFVTFRPFRSVTLAAAMLATGLGEVRLAAQDAAETRAAVRAGRPEAVQPQPAVKLAAPSPAPQKAEPSLRVSLSPDGQTVYLVGMILDGSFHRFDAVMRSAPKVRRVHLSSAGGYTIEARLIAALVRKRKLDSYVEFYCASACTQVFAAGQERVIGPHAKVGFHQAVMIDPTGMASGVRLPTSRKLRSTTVFGVNGNDTLRLAYELAGIDQAFIDKALSYGHEKMWLPSPQELVDARVVTRVAPASEVAPALGGGGTREAVRTRLLDQPLWRAGLARLPQITEAAIDDVWRASNSGYSVDQAVLAGRSKLIMAGSHGMARAPDAFLDRSLALYAGSARSQRERGYPGCKADSITGSRADDSDDFGFEQTENALVADFFMSDERVAAMDGSEATHIFAREVLPLLTTAYRTGELGGTEGRCRIGFQTFEAIDAMPAKKRVRAYRAMLSLPGLADGG